MSSLKRFFYTYFRVLKLAYQIHPGLLITLTVVNLLSGLTNLPVLYINKALIDLVIASVKNPNWSASIRILIILLMVRTVVSLTRNILSRINTHMSFGFGNLMNDRIGVILGEKLNSLDVPTVENPDFQDKYRKVERESKTRIWGMLATLQEIPNSVTTIMSGVIPLLSFNPLMVGLVLLAELPDAFVSAKLVKINFKVKDERRRQYRILSRLENLVTDILQFYENKISGNVGYLSRKIREHQDSLFKLDYDMRLNRIKWRTLTDFPGLIVSLGLSVYFFADAILGKISLGLAQMLYQSATTLGDGTSVLLNNVATIYEHYLFVKDYTWFMDLSAAENPGSTLMPAVLSAGIQFEHVWFKYQNSDNWILQDVNFTIGPKENLAIVGENGAGKTTLLKLLLGFYKPHQGVIKINGKDINEYQLNNYWRNISILPQEFLLFPFSAQESIAFSDLSRVDSIAEIKEAAKHVEIDNYIESLPKGYATPLTKDLEGVEPSGGQKQRIAIARTLFKKSLIMILDEPTSNVDPKAEEAIFKNVLKVTKNQIVILVSHRFSTVRRANKILLLENGQVKEFGNHNSLMKQNGLYAKLFNLQAKSYQ